MLDKSSVDKARLLYYGLFSKFLVFKANSDVGDALAIIKSSPIDPNTLQSASSILETVDKHGTKPLHEEYNAIFHNPNNHPINPTVSFYEEGIEFGKKCIQTKELLSQTLIRRDEKSYKDPEDSYGFLMVFMCEMIKGAMAGNEKYKKIQLSLFNDIINPYIDLFTDDLYDHPKSKNYKDVAILLNSFMEFERVYFEIGKPPKQKRVKKEYGISAAEAKRRALNKAKKEADKKNKT